MEIQLSSILFQAFNFGLLVFLLNKLLYKPVIKILDQRSERIEEGMKAAKINLEEKDKLEIYKKKEINRIEKEAGTILDQAKKSAEKVAETIVGEARLKAAALIKKEDAAFKSSLIARQDEFERKLIDLVTLTTKAALRDSLSSKDQINIINQNIRNLPKYKVN